MSETLYNDFYINPNGALSATAHVEHNATKVYELLDQQDFTINAIAAVLGNMEAESGINPARWSGDNVGVTSGALGLCQWHPTTKLTDWIEEEFGESDPYNGEYQCLRIQYERENSLQWMSNGGYTLTFDEFATGDYTVDYLARAWMLCYERPGNQSESAQNYRAKLAKDWYTFLTGEEPDDGTDTSGKLPVWLYFKFKRK